MCIRDSLITALLTRGAERDGQVDFKDFYIRRARRLLPAACLSLILTGLACLIILPKTLLHGVGKEILTSAFYVENFFLYFQGKSYLSAETAPLLVSFYRKAVLFFFGLSQLPLASGLLSV